MQSDERKNAIFFFFIYFIFVFSQTLSKILCKWEQDSAVSLFLYLDSVFKNYIWILFSKISINWFIIKPQL